MNESIFKWLQRDYLLFLTGSFNSNQHQTLWAEWDLVEVLFNQIGKLFPESKFGIKRSEKIKEMADNQEGATQE